MHMIALKKVLRYLKGTRSRGLTLGGSPDSLQLTCSADSDHAGDLATRRSRSGYLFFLGEDGAVSWASKLQSVVAISTREAEHYALSLAVQEALHLRQLVVELLSRDTSTTSAEPVYIHQDNQSTIRFSNNSIVRDRTKHIDIRYHFVKDRIDRGTIQIGYLPTDQMSADALIKPLPLCTLYMPQGNRSPN